MNKNAIKYSSLGLIVVAGALFACKKDKEEKASPEAPTSAAASAAPAPTQSAAAEEPEPVRAKAPAEPSLPPVEIKEGKSFELAGQTVSGEICKIDGPYMRHKQFSKAIRSLAMLPGGAVAVLDHEGKLRKYKKGSGEGCVFTLDKSFGENGILKLGEGDDSDRFDTLDSDNQGNLYASGFMAKPQKITDGKVSELCSSSGRLQVEPGLDYGVKRRKKVSLSDCQETDVTLAGWPEKTNPQFVIPFENGFASAATLDKKYRVKLHGPAGNETLQVGDEDGDGRLCNVGGVQACKAGVCVLDANCRAIRAWSKAGKFVGYGKVGDLVGLSYPWPVDFEVSREGGYMAMTHKGKDEKDVNFGMIVRVSGLM